MTVSTTAATNGPYSGNGATVAFPFNFKALTPGEVKVTVNGAEVSAALYTVTLNAGGNGGTVTMATAPASGTTILLDANPDFTQQIGFTNSGPFLAKSHEEALDRSAVRDIYLKAKIEGGLTALIASSNSLASAFASVGRNSLDVKYTALGQMLQSMRLKPLLTPADPGSVRARDGRFSDVFTDATGINAGASQYYDHDTTRHVIGTQRALKSSVAPEEDFESIADWTTNVNATVVDPGDPDIVVGKVVEISSGATAGGQGTLRKYFGVIPASFGMMIMTAMVTLLMSAAEAFEWQAQNANGHVLKMRLWSGVVQAFYDGAWNTLFPYGGGTTFFTEWWTEVTFNSGSRYTVRFFAGTQELPGFTGNLPTGNGGENGFVSLIQNSSATGSTQRKARVALLQVGSSTIPVDMTLVSVAQNVSFEPTQITLAIMFEDVCFQTVVNTDLKADVTEDGGENWYPVTLANYGEWEGGVLTYTAPVYFLAGTVNVPTTGTKSIAYRIRSDNGRYFSLNGVSLVAEA